MQSVSMNGLNIRTDKSGMSMTGDVIVFSDGSVYNIRTRAFNNAGPGSVWINGRLLENNSGDPSAKPAAPTTKTRVFPSATVLSLIIEAFDVEVATHDQPGMKVEMTGPANLLEQIKLEEHAQVLTLHDTSSNDATSISISGNMITTSRRGRIANMVGGVRIFDGNNVFISSSSGKSDVKITVFVPKHTPVDIDLRGTGDVTLVDVGGPLSTSLSGTGDIIATEVSGVVSVGSSGTGDVTLDDGEVSLLTVRASGTGDVTFDGTAQRAHLTASGTGDIKVRRSMQEPFKSNHGTGRIRVKQIG